jgi:hypothetical protein
VDGVVAGREYERDSRVETRDIAAEVEGVEELSRSGELKPSDLLKRDNDLGPFRKAFDRLKPSFRWRETARMGCGFELPPRLETVECAEVGLEEFRVGEELSRERDMIWSDGVAAPLSEDFGNGIIPVAALGLVAL